MPPPTKIAIIGGGIAGLTTAVALRGLGPDFEIHIYEASSCNFSDIGAGIGMFPRIWKILQYLGLERDLMRAAREGELEHGPNGKVLAFQLRKSDQPEGYTYYDVFGMGGFLSFHRADFQNVLLAHLPQPSGAKCFIHYSKRLISLNEPLPSKWSSTKPVTLNFLDGSVETCDLVIGADGLHSPTRSHVLQQQSLRALAEEKEELAEDLRKDAQMGAGVVWSGTLCYRGLVEFKDKTRAGAYGNINSRRAVSMIYCGKNKHIVTYPIPEPPGYHSRDHNRTAFLNVAAFSSRPSLEGTSYNGETEIGVSKEEMLAEFAEFEGEVLELLERIEHPTRWAIHALKPLGCYVSRRVALIGDAPAMKAHAMTPHQGSGPGQAIEDAYILSTLLMHPLCDFSNPAALAAALETYDAVRRPVANAVLQSSRSVGMMYEYNWPGYTETDIYADSCAHGGGYGDAGAGGSVVFQGDGRERLNIPVLKELGEMVNKIQEWVWRSDIDGDTENAAQMFRRAIGHVSGGQRIPS